ncbi:MAG: (2Fe-2S)-binding protein [Gammaproteobacteria bacterium]|nr:(2Fe-2S)-binding protein [Gammaproteobacteria bacterium]
MSDKQEVSLKVNGENYHREIEPRTLLSDFIRHDLALTGTHVGCEHGICGSCTILVDGLPVRSCLMFAVQAEGKSIETVESLATDGQLSVLQNAFWENQGLQCGFCTSGILMSMKAFLEENPNPSREDIREALSGNLCRCTGYHDIVDSVAAAAESLTSSGATR